MDLPSRDVTSRVRSSVGRTSRLRDVEPAESRVRYSGGREVNAELLKQFPDEKGFSDKTREILRENLDRGRFELLEAGDEFFGFQYGIERQGLRTVAGKRVHKRNGSEDRFSYVIFAEMSDTYTLVNVSPETIRETAYEAAKGLNGRYIPS